MLSCATGEQSLQAHNAYSSRTTCSVFYRVGNTESFSLHYWQAINKLDWQTMTFSPHSEVPTSYIEVNLTTFAIKWWVAEDNSQDLKCWPLSQWFSFCMFCRQDDHFRSSFPQHKIQNKIRPHFRPSPLRLKNLRSAVTASHHVFTDAKQTHVACCTCVWETAANFSWCWTVFTVSFSKRGNQTWF